MCKKNRSAPRSVKEMKKGDLYVQGDDPQPFWRTRGNMIMTVGNDGSTWELYAGGLFPATRIYKNYRIGEK